MHPLLNPKSLLWKITALVAVASCVVATVIGILVHTTTNARSQALGKERAYTELNTAADTYTRTGTADDAILDPAQIPPDLLSQVTPHHRTTWYDDHGPGAWMWAAAHVNGHVIAVRIDMGGEQRNLAALDRHIILAALATLVAVIPLSALAAELLSRRLRHAAHTARRIATGDLNARIRPTGQARDEVTDLSAAVDCMADSLHQRLHSEQRFTADVAHELRTPLAGLVTSAELLPPGQVTTYVWQGVQTLRTLVEDLLEISRLDAGAEHADLTPVPLDSAIEKTVRRTGLPAQITVTNPAIVSTDPRRLDRVITNLLTNAHRHGQQPVEVTVNHTTITIRDHGPGFPDELLRHGPQRFRTGTPERGRGCGLGLTIALGQAQVLGAHLELANAPDGGAVATLRLTA
ncbi:HAMP domain-containing sensor histidine kinase [Streptomyces klenkii]|uniref:HAMP domain-containing sensor histidine kinase n=1 Tax=Streptomyces klenkii TaxID=1420899 RepID=UPI003416728D